MNYQQEQELLTAGEWSRILGISDRAVALGANRRERVKDHHGVRYPLTALPAEKQALVEQKLREHHCHTPLALLNQIKVNTTPTLAPAKAFEKYSESAQVRAAGWREVMEFFAGELERCRRIGDAEQKAVEKFLEVAASGRFTIKKSRGRKENVFKVKRPTTRTIRKRWARALQFGGVAAAPWEAYCDEKSCPHPNAKNVVKLNIPREFIAALQCQAAMPGIRSKRQAVRKFEIDWLAGREVPGLGAPARPGLSFPYRMAQLKDLFPEKDVLTAGRLGKAAARRDALPCLTNDWSKLRPAELYVLDDSRLDIVATDDATGNPVEMRGYWMLEVSSRRIVGFLFRQNGGIHAKDVQVLTLRGLNSGGIAPAGAGYHTTILYERGATACSTAFESLLTSLLPGRIAIRRTAMNGGRNFDLDYLQESSGHWMGKAVIESLMRTLAFFLSHLPGQRGGTYQTQPAQLGLVGRDRESGKLRFLADSQMAVGTLAARVNAGLERLPQFQWVNGRLRIKALKPVSWIQAAVLEVVAYYNQRTDHEMRGFRRVDELDENGAVKHRVESPNERAEFLEKYHGLVPERLPYGMMPRLLQDFKWVTVKQNGFTMDVDPRKGLRFWSADSICCRLANKNGGEKKFLALFDREALSMNTGPQEVYLCGSKIGEKHWEPGDPVVFHEHLPLYHNPNAADIREVAKAAAETARVNKDMQRRLERVMSPEIKRRAEDEEHNNKLLSVITSQTRLDLPLAGRSEFADSIAESRNDARVVQEHVELAVASDPKTISTGRLTDKMAERKQRRGADVDEEVLETF
ncbi:MAG: hypothetical protein LBK76_08735 [Verrucomicrobiales bacterium]|nr:hypothetical protein [Verrucomicrobiales bacterium]